MSNSKEAAQYQINWIGLTIFWGLVFGILALAVYMSNKDPERPPNVPRDAVYVRWSKEAGGWQRCVTIGREIECQIYNQGGIVLEDGEFLPSDGGVPPTAADLSIDPSPPFPGSDRIFLKNHRILIPAARFDELQEFLYERGLGRKAEK